MTQNTNSIDSLIAEDHYSFGVENGGFHKQVRLPSLDSIPLNLIAASGTLYVKQINNGVGGIQAQEFYTNGASGNEYQITRTDNTNFPTFGLFTGNSGWTFLPGGIRLQYGLKTETNVGTGTTTVVFPIAYTTIYTVTATRVQVAGASQILSTSWGVNNVTNTGFQFTRTQGIANSSFYWTAIGI
jgi:hypothetical protein